MWLIEFLLCSFMLTWSRTTTADLSFCGPLNLSPNCLLTTMTTQLETTENSARHRQHRLRSDLILQTRLNQGLLTPSTP